MDGIYIVGNFLKKIYATPAIALIVFSILFLIIKGTKALKPSQGTANEAAHNILLILTNSIIAAFIFTNLGIISDFIYGQLGVPHIPKDFWLSIPKPVIFIITLLMLDFANYWGHRLLHTKYFWGIHALHHSDTHMTWTTSYRIHVLEFLVMKVLFVVIIGWMFLPIEVIGFAAIIRSWHAKFIHCQLGWTFGKFAKVISSPNFHRWHHSIEAEAYGKNLCIMFPFWDVLFGTYYDPGLCETELGVENAPTGFLRNQLYPFKYALDALKSRLPKRPLKPLSKPVSTPPQIP